jgi:hypothetical protein
MLSVKKLESGYFHIRGIGTCNWAQVPYLPCSEQILRRCAFHEAGKEFIEECLANDTICNEKDTP